MSKINKIWESDVITLNVAIETLKNLSELENVRRSGDIYMELIDRNKIEYSPIEIYDFDEHKHEVTGMALFKDIEKIPTVKAIPLDEVKKAKEEIENLTPWDEGTVEMYDVLEIIDKLIK